jgi:dihydroflavonol-4-reductase
MPAFVDTKLNVVNIEDVALGHVRALERGTVGERYLLGDRNMSLNELFGLLASASGVQAPRLRIPFWVATAAGFCSETVQGKLLGKEPSISLDSVRVARKRREFDCSKAKNQFEIPVSTVPDAVSKAVDWYEANGYVSDLKRRAIHG